MISIPSRIQLGSILAAKSDLSGVPNVYMYALLLGLAGVLAYPGVYLPNYTHMRMHSVYVLRGSTGNFNTNFTTNALTT